MNMNNNKSKLSPEQQAIVDFYDDYKTIITNQERFISFDKLIASVLLKDMLGFDSEAYIQFNDMLMMAVNKKYDLVYKDFVITYNLNPKFGLNNLVPMLNTYESSNNEAINLKSSSNRMMNKFLTNLNAEINNLLLTKYYVEVIPETILYTSDNTNELMLLFSENVATKIMA